MANIANIAKKAATVAEIKEKLEKAQSVVIVDYRGLTVAEVTELRNTMRKAGVHYEVLKNSLVERAAKEADLLNDQLAQMLKGPSAFAFGYDDVVAPAKALKDCIKKFKKCEIKGGLIEGKVSGAKTMDALADLPPRDVLIARILGSMKAPITGLAIALNQIKGKLEEANA